MTAILEKVEKEVLSLSNEERAFLADRLLSSLNENVLTDIDSAWIVEAEHRYSEYLKGNRQPIPAKNVFDEVDRMLG